MNEYLSLAGTAFAYAIWFRGIARLPTVAVASLGVLSPLTAVAFGWVLRPTGYPQPLPCRPNGMCFVRAILKSPKVTKHHVMGLCQGAKRCL